MLQIGVGVSPNKDLIAASQEAAKEAASIVKAPKLLVVFITCNYPKEKYETALKQIQRAFPKEAPLIGGEVSGVFAKDRAFHTLAKALIAEKEIATNGIGPERADRGVGILALGSEYLNVGVGIGKEADKNPEEAGKTSILQALDNLEYNPSVAYLAMMKRGIRDIIHLRPIGGFLITPSLAPSHGLLEKRIVEGIESVTKKTVRLIGCGASGGGVKGWGKEAGTASEDLLDFRFPPSHQFFNGKVFKESVISVVFGSDLEIGYGVAPAFQPVGAGTFVTKAKGWIVYECDGRPAAEVMAEIYEKYAGYPKEKFLADPLQAIVISNHTFGVPEATGGFYWPNSTLKIIDKKHVLMMWEVQEGTGLAFLKTNAGLIRNSDFQAAKTMIDDAGTDNMGLVLFFTTPGREIILLKENPGAELEEIQMIRKAVGPKCTIFGMSGTGMTGFYKSGPNMTAVQTLAMLGISNTLISEAK